MGMFDDFKDALGMAGSVLDVGGKAIGLFGGDGGARDRQAASESMARESMQLQKDFAQQGIRWRVADAKAAGIHPGLALGAQLSSPNPVTLFNDGGSGPSEGELVSQFGQSLHRAVDATRTPAEKVASRLSALQIERAELENDVLRARLATMGQQPGTPGFAPGSGDGSPVPNLILEKPLERTPGYPGRGDMEPGALVDRGFVWTGTGFHPVPGENTKQRIEDTMIPEALWSLRNYLVPRGGFKPPNSILTRELIERGFNDLEWNVWKQEWQPVRRREVYRGAIPLSE